MNKRARELLDEVFPALNFNDKNFYSELIERIDDAGTKNLEIRQTFKGGEKIIGLTLRRFRNRYITILFRDITSIVKLQEAIERQNNALRMGLMTSTLIHEIANPIASVRAALELILSNQNLPRDVIEIIHRAYRGTDTINSLIKRLRSRGELNIERINIKEPILEAIQMCSHKIENTEIEIEFNVEDHAVADKFALTQIVRNIIDNSIEALRNIGNIRISSYTGEDFIHIKITDNGPGIDEETKKHIFTPFFTTKPDGTGLGLPISLSLAKKMGGDLIVESKQGKGTTVTLLLRKCDEKGFTG